MIEDGKTSEPVPQQPGRWVRAGRALRRHWLLTAAAAAIVVAGGVTAALVLPGGYGETVTGPAGSFPAPLAVTGQPRVLTHYYGRVVLDGGLAVVGGGNHVRTASGSPATAVADGITAVSLHTGKIYWSYQRPGHAVVSVSAWQSGLYVLWDDGLLVQMNPRTAAIAWHHSVGTAVGPSTEVLASGGPAQRADVVVVAAGGIEAVSQTSGSLLWSAAPGRQCAFYEPALTADTLVVGEELAGESGCASTPLRGYALSDGQLRWQKPNESFLQPMLPVSPSLIAVEGSGQGTIAVLDANSGRVADTIKADATPGTVDGHGLVLGTGSSGSFGAWRAATGRMLWRQLLPAGETLLTGPFLGTGNTADLITSSPGPQIPDGLGDGKTVASVRLWLYRYDGGTGRLLSRTSLPVLSVAGSGAAGLAHMQAGLLADPVSVSDGVTAFIETSTYETGVTDADPSAVTTLPDVLVSG